MYEEFLNVHKHQLLACGIPEIFWPTVYEKVTNDDFNSNNIFQMLMIDYENDIRQPEDPLWAVQVSHEDGLRKDDPKHVYLIDHAWTYRLDSRNKQLMEIPHLKGRMCKLMGIDELSDIDAVCKEMWKYCQNYAMNGTNMKVEDCMPVWYIMDELGSRIQHSDSPNVRIVPFLYVWKQMTYSLMFPISDIPNGGLITRDFIEGVPNDSLIRKALLLPWYPYDFRDTNFLQVEPGPEYFLSGRVDESLPEETLPPEIQSKPLKVYTQYKYVQEYLKSKHFVLCEDDTSADILWYTQHFKNYKELSSKMPNTFVNQFPFESVITIKDLLSVVSRRKSTMHYNEKSLETFPEWLPTTFNLQTELTKFVSYFQNREDKNLNNIWICKPFNLARSLDTHITNDLNCILRICRSGPKIAQKYIEDPVLFARPDTDVSPEQRLVKFDIRYVLLLKSVDPLEAYIYNNFFLRFANKPFDLNDFDDYEKHFTVMNYNENATLFHLKCDEFKSHWRNQYPEHDYCDIEKNICQMLAEMLQCATCKDPPFGIHNNTQSRALYAVDIMLQWSNGLIQPKLLEVNWMPDCKRACEYYPDFYDNIFELLFLDEFNKEQFQKL